MTRRHILLATALLAACYSPQVNRNWADRAAYGLLDGAFERVAGAKREFVVERAVDTLRKRLFTSTEPVTLSLTEALDVAAENSRDFQRQKETLYLSALSLTSTLNDFRVKFGGGGGGGVNGTGRNDTSNANLSDDLSASANTVAGTRVVASFVQNFLRSLLNGGDFDGSSILNLSFTQPLLRGAGRHIAREPLTQAERNVIYALRDFERFRANFSVQVVGDYWNVVLQMANLASVEATYESLVRSRVQIEELHKAGRKTVVDLGRAQQSEYQAAATLVTRRNQLQTSLDRFKLTLGLPITALVQLDSAEMERLVGVGVVKVELSQEEAIELALGRRYDYRTTIDQVEDVGRRVLIAENSLDLQLDLTGAIQVPGEPGKSLNLDWQHINWSAGVELDLLLDRIPLRNAYRSQLITFDQTIRAREQAEDQLTANVRSSLRNIQAAYESFRIQSLAVELNKQRVEATTDLYDAGRVQAFDKLDAQNTYLQTQLDRNAAIVAYAIARLDLMNNLEAINLNPQGLRFDLTLPQPAATSAE